MTGRWTALHVDVAEALVDAVANFLLEQGVGGVVTDVHESTGAPPPPGRARLEAHVPGERAEATVAAVRTWLASLADVLPAAADAVVTTSAMEPVDWQAVFREHHRPLAIGRRLLVAPPWDVPVAPDRIVLVIEPGMAFGTGQHATTRTCLEEIDALVDARVGSALDVGTGSGVLAAAMRRLGVARVVALDCDPTVVGLARTTLAANGVADVQLLAGTAACVRARFDLVVANLLADALVADAAALRAAVGDGGRLIVSGLLEDQVLRVTAAYPDFVTTAVRGDGAWRTLRLERTPSPGAARTT